MDGQRFDTLSRFLAGGESRRNALRLAGAALLGGGLLRTTDAAAKNGNANKKECDRIYKECDDYCDALTDKDAQDTCEDECKRNRDTCRDGIKGCEKSCDNLRDTCREACGGDDEEEDDGSSGQCRKECNQERKACRNTCRGR